MLCADGHVTGPETGGHSEWSGGQRLGSGEPAQSVCSLQRGTAVLPIQAAAATGIGTRARRRTLFDTGSMKRDRWLLCDADDTLWENNVFFEEAIAEFIAYIDHPEFSPAEVREELDRVEIRNIKLHGYGTDNFAHNLVECYELFRERPASSAERRRLVGMTDRIRNSPIRLIPGVTETLDELRERYLLGLVTKGKIEEQLSKLERSGLKDRFDYIRTLPEKDAESYRTVISETGADPGVTWMIGNSPKSDIKPALEAGLGAVLVPNENTWGLEVVTIPKSHPRFRLVERFSDLTSIF